MQKERKMVFKPRCDVWQYFENIVGEGIAVCKLCKQRLKNYSSYVLRRHIQKLHNANSEVWKYFDNLVGEGLAVCKQCQHRVRNNRSFNLKQHLQVSHNILVNDIDEGFSLKKPARISNEVDSSLPNINDGESTEQASVSTNVKCGPPKESVSKRRTVDTITIDANSLNMFLDIEMEEKSLMSAVWGLMLDDGVAPVIFGSKNMQSILQPICKAISVRENKECIIDEFSTEIFLDLATKHMNNDFSSNLNWRLLSLKIDMDINGPAKTFCVSTTFINEEKMEERILGVIDLKDDSSQLNEKHITKILSKHNIDSSQIISISCDFSKAKYNTKVQNSEYLKEIENFETYPVIQFCDLQLELYAGAIAQHSLLDIFKNSDIFEPFLKCRNFVKFISDEENDFVDIFEQNNLNVPELDSPWKWGSTYKMIHDLQQAHSILNDLNYPIIENPEDQFEVNDDMWLFIDGFCESLKFLQKSITKYYSEEIHFGDFYAQWLKSKLLTGKLASNPNIQNKYLTIISKELIKCIEARSKDILSKDYFKACLYLDPRFHHTLGTIEKTLAIDYLKKLWSLSKIFNPDVTNTTTECQKEPTNSQHFNDDEDAFLNAFLCQDVQKSDTRTNAVYDIIENLKLPFKPVDTNVLLFWQNLKSNQPEMYALSVICFAIPTTQIYNRNCYAHIYKTGTLSNLPETTRDNLLNISLNSRLVKNSIEQILASYEAHLSDDDVEIIDCNDSFLKKRC